MRHLYRYDFKAPGSTSASGSPCRSKFNLVGPRDYRSNIRKIIYAKSKDETRQVSHTLYQLHLNLSRKVTIYTKSNLILILVSFVFPHKLLNFNFNCAEIN